MTNRQEYKFLLKFGKNIAKKRKNRGMTQQQLAEQVDMSVVAIAYIETGKRWARPGTLYKIAKVLRTSVSDLFNEL